MRLRACIALLLFLSACTTTPPSPREPAARDPRLANLQRAAELPWTDGGRCVVQEASQPWPMLVERCFHALEHDRIDFHDTTGRCAVASAGAAAVGIGLCVLVAPEIVVGAVIVTGVVVVGFAIKEALDAYELKRGRPEKVRPVSETRPVPETKPAPQEPLAKRRPKPEPKGPDFPPLGPIETSERERRRKCEPIPGPPRGGNDLHNTCANNIPNNTFPGSDVFVNGKNFDALQLATRTLWEVKTDDFDKHSRRSQQFFIEVKLPEIQRERRLAEECGYDFVVGVRSEAHKNALKRADRSLKVVVMDWC
ncbi:DUF6310 domain-containing protein [Archangium sp.]|uniref:DUF6310 domain-containing protein n=1 Tax=Archangium sp. TaxID=1872627 RepID=UPI002D4E1708|nr:DUF6310 domain-containing protein [Archangium sp.]HYO55308.1 DUF6310 domain-containing protein [Archangium sp.]